MKEFADDSFKVDVNGRKFSKWVGNAVGKGEIAHYEQISPFPTAFSKLLNCRHVKTRTILLSGMPEATLQQNFGAGMKIKPKTAQSHHCSVYHIPSWKLNPFPNKPWFSRVCTTGLLKTLWEKEKLLIMSNFSFSLSVFYPLREHSAILIKFIILVCKLFQFGRVQSLLFGKGLKMIIIYQTANPIWFNLCVQCPRYNSTQNSHEQTLRTNQ